MLARQLHGDAASSIGRLASFEFMRGTVAPRIIGVVEAIRYDGLTTDLRPELYRHAGQAEIPPSTLVYRTTNAPLSEAASIRAVWSRADASGGVTLERWSTLEDLMARSFAQARFFFVLTGSFALIAALLALLGVYGTLSHWIGEHRRELGIRVALGADQVSLATLVIRRGLWLATAGAVAGLTISLSAANAIAHLLFEVSPTDPLLLLVAAGGLVGLAGLACAVPARRAMRIDPTETLK